MPTRRNPYFMHPLMRKGGAHQPSRSGERHSQRQALMDELDEYMEMKEANELSSSKDEEGFILDLNVAYHCAHGHKFIRLERQQ